MLLRISDLPCVAHRGCIGGVMAGKGDRPRPVDKAKYDKNWAQIRWKKKERKRKAVQE